MANSYVALDLETTGLDREADTIIEIGAVRFDQAGVLGTFSTLVNPQRAIPPQIEALTGITDDAVRKAPPLATAAAELQDFLGDAALVGHNIIAFDTLFLDRAGVRHSPVLYDTQELSSLLLPGLPEYSLAALVAHFGITPPARHRAAADADAARELFLALQQQAASLPLDVLSQVAQWLTPTNWPWRAFFAQTWEAASRSGNGAARSFRPNNAPIAPPLTPEKQPRSIPAEQALAVLASAAERADLLPDFDERMEQREMISAVAAAFNDGKRLLVEAGTGTGKSLAYLIPAACQAAANRRRVVVSTATINLQEQLTHKDIPALQALLGGPEQAVRACQLKGRRNYLCLKRFEALRSSPAMSDAEALLASRVLIWLCQTESGDRVELRLSPAEEAVWQNLSADGAQCSAENSPYMVDGSCFLQRARRTAEASHIVVVNHALLLSDTGTGGRVLPPYEHLIVDEAHHLEEEATRQFGFSGGERRLAELLDRCESLAPSMQSRLRGSTAALAPYDLLMGATRAVRQLATAARPRLRQFAEQLSLFLGDHTIEVAEHEQRLHINRGMRVQPDWTGVELAWENLRLTLTELASALDRLQGALAQAEGSGMLNQEMMVAETGNLLSDVQGAVAGLAAAIEEDDPQRVVWLERERADGSLIVSWVPLTVGDLLREKLYADRKSIVLTGATLRSQGDFAYLQERLGLEDADTLALGSPFDYKKAALVLLPRDMPEPSSPDYLKVLSLAIVDLARASRGRALVLFTAYSSLRAVHALVQEALTREGINVLGQGIDGSPRQMVRALQASANTVLLGTASFWEGVDIVGETLSLLVMARLPFAVPTEPVFAARSALYDDPFERYALPQAVLRFKQGFGRLIRSKRDRGVVAVLDRRILSKSYGTAFLESMPPCAVQEVMLREMPDLVEGWLAPKAVSPA